MKTKLLLLVFITTGMLSIVSAQCDDPTANAELNIGNIKAFIPNDGALYWDRNNQASSIFEVPNVTSGSSILPLNSLDGGAIFMSARESNNDLKVAGMIPYNGFGNDFYPGPIDNITGLTDFATCTFYDQIWEVLDTEIQSHVALANASLPIPINQIASNILTWPAKGNAHITTVSINQDLAPFQDVNLNGIYDPENGDYPLVYGDQALFWVMNDIGGFHSNSNGEKLGVEIHCLVYAYDNTNSILTNTIIHDYKIINKSFGNLNDFCFGLYTSPYLYNGNRTGCDTLSNTAFFYNETTNTNLTYPSIITSTFLNKEMTAFIVHPNVFGGFYDPPYFDPIHYDNCLNGLWKDGSFITIGGDGYNPNGGIPTNYVYSGNPASSFEWSECTTANNNEPQEVTQSSGPHTFNAWSTFEIAWAVHATFPSNYSGCPDFTSVLQPEIDSIQSFFDNRFNNYNYEVVTGLREKSILETKISIYPNPAQDVLRISGQDLNLTQINLIGIDGKVIQSLNHPINNEVINLEALNSGIYLLEINAKEGRLVKKIVKE